ncbi:DUF938 domain-containing protein [Phenylobacterium sp.]|jgi:SAM-dependent methyltransferase|uniref:DUF938 domain-containing protein n=1 Tax=Phenylobacterium sp. TaxID=1871053 RepID=UPI002E30AA2F|nr:DUF938 domain-containing protein [Phenylobacterium sp.]HEX2560690.1 DUF938 domain-containing protein [Phenylobacterium sp.]
MSDIPPGALSSAATARNRDPILAVLRARLPERARVLEVASGAGEHAVWMARGMPGVVWRPTDPSQQALASIAVWRATAGLPNLLPPLQLDAADPSTWPAEGFDAVVCINMIHISPWAAAEGLMALAAQALPGGGLLYLYGPYLEAQVPTAPSNLAFNEDLTRRNPEWGLRRLEEVAALAAKSGLKLSGRIEMPANNLSLWFEKAG